MATPWKVVFAFVLVFMAGAIFGGVFTVAFSVRRVTGPKAAPPVRTTAQPPVPGQPPSTSQPRPPATGPQGQPPAAVVRPSAITPTLMRQFTQRLGLSAEQKERIRPIVGRAGEDLARLRQENLTDTARVTDRMYTDVAAVLTLEQRAELETMQRQVQERIETERKKRLEAAAAAEAARKQPNAVPATQPGVPAEPPKK